MSILCSTVPSPVATPTSLVSGNQVIIDWFTPTLNGQQLLGYTVYFRKHGGTYATELTHCDGSDPTITFYSTCTVPLSTFTASPFNLVLGEQINV